MKRWKVVATYRSESGPIDVQHDIQELHELHDLIELGPDWNSLVVITLADKSSAVSVEEAARR